MTAAEFDLRLCGRKTRLRVHGDGSPVVLIHGGGLGSSGNVWRAVVPHLAAVHRVFVPDLIGFGESSTPDVEDGLPLFIRQVTELIEVLCLDTPTLVGHSMGCQIATAIALQFPDRVRAFGLLACGGGFVGLTYKSAGHTLLEEVVANPSAVAVRVLVEMVNGVLDDADAETAERMRWAQNSDHLAAQRHLIAGRQRAGHKTGAHADINRLPMPILLGWGECERFNPVDLGPQIAARLPRGSRYHLFHGAGHNIPHDCPAEVAREIIELARARPSTPA